MDATGSGARGAAAAGKGGDGEPSAGGFPGGRAPRPRRGECDVAELLRAVLTLQGWQQTLLTSALRELDA